jgi:glycosyltransferase involved in cell wall biosynthesis
MVIVHSSDEMYGADRMVLEMVAAAAPAIAVEVWLPTDIAHPTSALCLELERRGTAVRHLPLPIVRRAYLGPRGMLGILQRAVTLYRALRAVHPTVLYCATSAALPAAPIGRLLRIPRVIAHQQEIWSRADQAALGGLARCCHRVVAISTASAASLPTVVRRRTTVVPNATAEPPKVVPLDGRTGPLHYLIASRWNGWKGHRTLLSAWQQAGCPGQLLVLGGRPPSGTAVDVPELVRALGISATVQVVGEVPDPDSYLERADVVLVPSDQPEPFGLVAIEAFARGRPVIASAAGGLTDIVTDGIDGWLFPLGDVGALARLLAGLDRSRVHAAGDAARRSYRQRYQIDRFAAQWRAAVLGPTTGDRRGSPR